MPVAVALCKHCQKKKVNRPRGLCWNCYYLPGVKEGYESGSKFAFRGLGQGFNPRLTVCEPTSAMPGTSEKLAVLCQRARLGQELWHADDAGVVEKRAVLLLPS
jgi:hypothetical protein